VTGMPKKLRDEIPAIALNSPTKVDSVLRSLRTRITHADRTYDTNKTKSHAFLRRRFGLAKDRGRRWLFPIELKSAIPRPDSAQGFRDWWNKGTPLLFAEGEEGCGKSWLIAQEAWRLTESGGALVLWLDSIQWESAISVRGVVETAFHVCLGIPDSDSDAATRLYRKLES
jgi:hypothetical protein